MNEENITPDYILKLLQSDNPGDIRNFIKENGVGWTGYEKCTLLMVACDIGLPGAAKVTVECGVDINQPDCYGNAPLHQAVECEYNEIANYLIDQGVDVNLRNTSGETPLIIACQGITNLPIAKRLVEADAKVNVVDESGSTALYSACVMEDEELVNYLLEKGADPNIGQDHEGDTALMHLPPLPIAKVLVEAGANIYAENRDGETVLSREARSVDREDTYEYLKKIAEDRIVSLRSLCMNSIYAKCIPHNHVPQAFFDR